MKNISKTAPKPTTPRMAPLLSSPPPFILPFIFLPYIILFYFCQRRQENREKTENAEMGSVQSKYPTTYDPYHQCLGGWRPCCEANYHRLETTPLYVAMYGLPHLRHRRGIFTYRRWVWFEETFFECLPQPWRLKAATDCGVCVCCARKKTPCLAPQRPGTYARWYAKKEREFFGRDYNGADGKKKAARDKV